MGSISRTAILASLATTLSGCAGMNMGSLAEILASGAGLYGSNVSGEIRSIDTRRQEIQLSSGYSGSERIQYDNRTEVVYQQRRYDVRDLEVGDYVQVQLADSRGERYAQTIYVQEGARNDRGSTQYPGGDRRIGQLDGTVNQIDQRQGWFELSDRYGSIVMVTLPYQANRGLSDRFQRLRRGDRVRIEGEWLNGSRMEVHRFF
jgi:hypothetical protein